MLRFFAISACRVIGNRAASLSKGSRPARHGCARGEERRNRTGQCLEPRLGVEASMLTTPARCIGLQNHPLTHWAALGARSIAQAGVRASPGVLQVFCGSRTEPRTTSRAFDNATLRRSTWPLTSQAGGTQKSGRGWPLVPAHPGGLLSNFRRRPTRRA